MSPFLWVGWGLIMITIIIHKWFLYCYDYPGGIFQCEPLTVCVCVQKNTAVLKHLLPWVVFMGAPKKIGIWIWWNLPIFGITWLFPWDSFLVSWWDPNPTHFALFRQGVAVYHSDAMCDHVFERCLSDGWHCTTLCRLGLPNGIRWKVVFVSNRLNGSQPGKAGDYCDDNYWWKYSFIPFLFSNHFSNWAPIRNWRCHWPHWDLTRGFSWRSILVTFSTSTHT